MNNHGEHFTTEVGDEETDYGNATMRVSQVPRDPYRADADNTQCLEIAAGIAFGMLEHQQPGTLTAVNIGLPQNPVQTLHEPACTAIREHLVCCGMNVTIDVAGCGCIVVRKMP